VSVARLIAAGLLWLPLSGCNLLLDLGGFEVFPPNCGGDEEAAYSFVDEETGHCFAVIIADEAANFDFAKQACTPEGYLACPNNKREFDIFNQRVGETVWIGLTDETVDGEYRCLTGDLFNPTDYQPWANGGPDGNGDCVVLEGASLRSESCGQPHEGYVCEVELAPE
jgi:hypothetical protein